MVDHKEKLLNYFKLRIENDELKNYDALKIINFVISAKKISDLYVTGFLSDITIYFNEKPYYLHRYFLNKSELLKKICEYSDNKKLCESNKIVINVKECTLNYILEYIYNDPNYSTEYNFPNSNDLLFEIYFLGKFLLIDDFDKNGKDVLDIKNILSCDINNFQDLGNLYWTKIYNGHKFEKNYILTYEHTTNYSEINLTKIIANFNFNKCSLERNKIIKVFDFIKQYLMSNYKYLKITNWTIRAEEFILKIKKIIGVVDILENVEIIEDDTENEHERECSRESFKEFKKELKQKNKEILLLNQFKNIIDYETFMEYINYDDDYFDILFCVIVNEESYEKFKIYCEGNSELLKIIELKYWYFKNKQVANVKSN